MRRPGLNDRRKIARQSSALTRGVADLVGVLAHWMIGGQADKNRFAIAKNQSEEIIEVVGDSYDLFRFDAGQRQVGGGLHGRGFQGFRLENGARLFLH